MDEGGRNVAVSVFHVLRSYMLVYSLPPPLLAPHVPSSEHSHLYFFIFYFFLFVKENRKQMSEVNQVNSGACIWWGSFSAEPPAAKYIDFIYLLIL